MRREKPDSCGSKLERKWETIDPLTDLGHGAPIVVGELERRLQGLCALDEKGHGGPVAQLDQCVLADRPDACRRPV